MILDSDLAKSTLEVAKERGPSLILGDELSRLRQDLRTLATAILVLDEEVARLKVNVSTEAERIAR